MIPIAEPFLDNEELQNVIEAVKSGWISSKGKFIIEFEEKFARYCGVKYGIATSNGTTALHLALEALGIHDGDEVIVPTFTFIATANVATYTGAKPVFVDCDPDYWCIDTGKIEDKITPRTKVIIPVHLYGHPCDMDLINKIAKDHDLFVIEDAAEAHGAEYRARKVGSFSDISCFSFFGNKIITTGEGGICLTDNTELAEKLRILRDHGQNPEKRYWYDVIGYNYRMTNLQAAIGVAQISKLDKLVGQKRQLAKWYSDELAVLYKQKKLTTQLQQSWAKSAYWMYSIVFEEDFHLKRDEISKKLLEEGIETRPLFYPVNILPPYQCVDEFPLAESLSRRGINLPSSCNITRDEVKRICAHILSLFSNNK